MATVDVFVLQQGAIDRVRAVADVDVVCDLCGSSEVRACPVLVAKKRQRKRKSVMYFEDVSA